MEKTFEESLNDLETIVKQLEDGDLPLDQSLKLFEDGVKLSRECRERLTRAERRIEILMKDADGDLHIETLGADDEMEAAADEPVTSTTRIIFEDPDEDDEPPF